MRAAKQKSGTIMWGHPQLSRRGNHRVRSVQSSKHALFPLLQDDTGPYLGDRFVSSPVSEVGYLGTPTHMFQVNPFML